MGSSAILQAFKVFFYLVHKGLSGFQWRKKSPETAVLDTRQGMVTSRGSKRAMANETRVSGVKAKLGMRVRGCDSSCAETSSHGFKLGVGIQLLQEN